MRPHLSIHDEALEQNGPSFGVRKGTGRPHNKVRERFACERESSGPIS